MFQMNMKILTLNLFGLLKLLTRSVTLEPFNQILFDLSPIFSLVVCPVLTSVCTFLETLYYIS